MELLEVVQKGGAFKTAQRLWLTLFRYYLRVEVEGIEHIPKKGPAIIIPNHSGYAGADAVILTFIIKRETRRRARILAHRAFFDFSHTLKAVAETFGLRKASMAGGVETLKKGRLLILFPEGESGNFKSTLKRYQLQPFHTGFLWMSEQADAPIIPCTIMGAEETHLNLGNINLGGLIPKIRIPLPLNLLPLPAKWRIRFYPPLDTSQLGPEPTRRKLETSAAKVQKMLQKELRAQLKERPYVYFRKTDQLEKNVRRSIRKLKKRLPL